jgi:DNA-binding MarR family transcriptional regulator
MGLRTLFCCVLWGALAAHILAQPMCVELTDKGQLKELERRGYIVVRNVPEDNCVWVELPPQEAEAMKAAVDSAVAAVIDEPEAAAAGGAGNARQGASEIQRKWLKKQARLQEAMRAALPFQESSCEKLKGGGVAKKCVASGL